MVERRLRILILVYLWIALIEDTLLFVISWIAPDLWFRLFHHSHPIGFDVAFLRRSAGQWAAFALAQAITLWRTKSAEGVSLVTFGGFNILQAIGILHGLYQHDPSITYGMAASLLTCGAVTLLTLHYRLKRLRTKI